MNEQQTIDVEMPDGVVVQGVPVGTSQRSLMARYSAATRPQPQKPAMDMQQVDLATGKPRDPADAMGAGVMKSATGMAGGLANLLFNTKNDPQAAKSIDQLREFSKPTSTGETVGKTGADIASVLAPGAAIKGAGLLPTLGRAAATGAVSGAQGGTPEDALIGAVASGAGDAIGAGIKGLKALRADRAYKDPALRNLISSFQDALSSAKAGAVESRSGVEARDVVRRSGIEARDEIGDRTLNDLRQRGQRAGVDIDRRGNFPRRTQPGGLQPVTSQQQAQLNVEEVWNSTPQRIKDIPGARSIYDTAVSNLYAGKARMPESMISSKYDEVKRIMDHYALRHAIYGGSMGAAYGGLSHGDPVMDAMKGAALGASPSLAIRSLPAAGKMARPLLTSLPAAARNSEGR